MDDGRLVRIVAFDLDEAIALIPGINFSPIIGLGMLQGEIAIVVVIINKITVFKHAMAAGF